MIFAGTKTGIAPEVEAWTPLGWSCSFLCEDNLYNRSVIRKNWPLINNIFTAHPLRESFYGKAIDVLFTRTVLHAFGISKIRELIHDPSDNATVALLAHIRRAAPRWVVWEGNTSALLDKDRSFETLLQGLAEFGYGFAYRVLDAQYFGSPQRHRRCYLVAHAGGAWQRAAAVLFDAKSLHRDSAEIPEEEDSDQFDFDMGIIQDLEDKKIYAPRLSAPLRPGSASRKSHSRLSGDARTTLIVEMNSDRPIPWGIRRLTPLEYERVMGFRDNYTADTDYEPANEDENVSDLRYNAVGGSVPIGILRWIGERIQIVDKL